MDEFLAAVRQSTISLQTVPLYTLVDQYLLRLQKLNPEQAAEYLHIAALLIYWKSRLLLPLEPGLLPNESDPKLEIVHALETAERSRRDHQAKSEADQENCLPEKPQLSLADLMVFLSEVQQNAKISAPLTVVESEVRITEQLQWLHQWFKEQSDATVTLLNNLWTHHQSTSAQTSLFLAVLELSKCGELLLEQEETFGPVRMRVCHRSQRDE